MKFHIFSNYVAHSRKSSSILVIVRPTERQPRMNVSQKTQEIPTRVTKTVVESVYERIRHDILDGTLEPGSKLRIERLRDSYSIGASTLREALLRLVGDALVISEGQRGFRVAPLSLSDLKDITDMRRLLEMEALRESITNGDDEWEADVVAAYHRLAKVEERLADDAKGVSDEWEARNLAFHRALTAACRNNWLLYFRNILLQQSERYRRFALVDKSVPRDVHAEHQAIYEATLDKDCDKAAKLLGQHIDRTFDVISLIAEQDISHAEGGRADLI